MCGIPVGLAENRIVPEGDTCLSEVMAEGSGDGLEHFRCPYPLTFKQPTQTPSLYFDLLWRMVAFLSLALLVD